MSDENDLIRMQNRFEKIRLDRNAFEDEWFVKNPPIKEFSLAIEGDLVHYGVWDKDDEWMVIFQMPDGKYHFKYKTFLDKRLIRALGELDVK